jgi:hypothetical protein
VPSTPPPQHVLDLLAQPNPAVMATVAADGRPVTVATRYLLERDGRVSLTALAQDDWYTHVSVQGHVVSIDDDEGLRDIDRLSQHYTGQPYRNRERPRVSAHVEIDRWHGWSGGTPIGD